jgi:hypothetical protein
VDAVTIVRSMGRSPAGGRLRSAARGRTAQGLRDSRDGRVREAARGDPAAPAREAGQPRPAASHAATVPPATAAPDGTGCRQEVASAREAASAAGAADAGARRPGPAEPSRHQRRALRLGRRVAMAAVPSCPSAVALRSARCEVRRPPSASRASHERSRTVEPLTPPADPRPVAVPRSHARARPVERPAGRPVSTRRLGSVPAVRADVHRHRALADLRRAAAARPPVPAHRLVPGTWQHAADARPGAGDPPHPRPAGTDPTSPPTPRTPTSPQTWTSWPG